MAASTQTHTRMLAMLEMAKGTDITIGASFDITLPDDGNYFEITGGGSALTTISVKTAGTIVFLKNTQAFSVGITTADNIQIRNSEGYRIQPGHTALFISDGTDWYLLVSSGLSELSTAGNYLLDGVITLRGASATLASLQTSDSLAITGTTADSVFTGIELFPEYSGAGTITRHHYITLDTPIGTGTVTKACALSLPGNPGTHKALAAHSGGGSPVLHTAGNAPCTGDPSGWLRIRVNIAGTATVVIVPFWTET